MAASCELIDHTGDIGLRVRGAKSLEELFETAAGGMYGILVDAPDVRPQQEASIVVEGETDELLHAWLAELLYRFSAEGTIFGEFGLSVGRGRLQARILGERLDPSRHRQKTELKAVTWHGLSVRQEKDGWMAEVIFDV